MATVATARSIVITGASTGIGKACALDLDKRGFRVFAGVRKEADGAALKQEASARLVPIFLDVTDAESIAAAVATVTAAVGTAGLAGLVNNAGIAVAGPLEFLPIAELRKQLEVNVVGQMAVTQAFLPLLRQGHGRIVNIGSVGGKIATPLLGPYAASKFAMEAITDTLRIELAPWGIAVAIVEPTSIATPIWEKSLAAGDAIASTLPEQAHDWYGRAIAVTRSRASQLGKAGVPASQVAKVVAHALTAQHPKTRYAVGRGARAAVLLARVLPDRLRDRLLRLPANP